MLNHIEKGDRNKKMAFIVAASKLTTSLVNVSLKFQMLISEKCQNFLLKKCENSLFNKKFQCIRL